jgi:hypothetical protein
LAVRENFSNIFVSEDPEEIARILDYQTAEQMLDLQLDGIRNVFTDGTVYDRLNYLYECCDMPYRYLEKPIYKYEPHTVPELNGTWPSDGYMIITGNKTPNCIQDLINAHKYTDVSFTCCGDRGDLAKCYNYTSSWRGAEDVMFDLSKVNMQSILNDGVPGNLQGFVIPGE